MRRRIGKYIAIGTIGILMIAILISVSKYLSFIFAMPFNDPPKSIAPTDLVGTWINHYGSSDEDKLILRADGKFIQAYKNEASTPYTFTTNWNVWYLEYLPSGGVRIHLEGARYFYNSIAFSETMGFSRLGIPCPNMSEICNEGQLVRPIPFYDPISSDTIFMVGKLVLNVRASDSGEYYLFHVWTSSDRGYPIIGGVSEYFQRETQ